MEPLAQSVERSVEARKISVQFRGGSFTCVRGFKSHRRDCGGSLTREVSARQHSAVWRSWPSSLGSYPRDRGFKSHHRNSESVSRFDSRHQRPVAQGQSACLTRKRSAVRNRPCLPSICLGGTADRGWMSKEIFVSSHWADVHNLRASRGFILPGCLLLLMSLDELAESRG